jgi:lipopolysaccharide biosynthesis regulator YciM
MAGHDCLGDEQDITGTDSMNESCVDSRSGLSSDAVEQSLLQFRSLKPQHKAVAALLATGDTVPKVAEKTGYAASTIYNLLNSNADFKQYVNYLATAYSIQTVQVEASTRAKIQAQLTTAADTLTSVMSGATNLETKRKAACDILNYGGMKPKETVEHQIMTPHLAIVDETYTKAPENLPDADRELLEL